MGKCYKIILSCVCIALVFSLLGFGIGKITDTAPATNGSPSIDVGDTESEGTDRPPGISFDDTEIGGEGVDVRFQDGRVWTIIADPSVIGDDFDWDNFDLDFWMTGLHDFSLSSSDWMFAGYLRIHRFCNVRRKFWLAL